MRHAFESPNCVKMRLGLFAARAPAGTDPVQIAHRCGHTSGPEGRPNGRQKHQPFGRPFGCPLGPLVWPHFNTDFLYVDLQKKAEENGKQAKRANGKRVKERKEMERAFRDQFLATFYACMQDRRDHAGLPKHPNWAGRLTLASGLVTRTESISNAEDECLLFWSRFVFIV